MRASTVSRLQRGYSVVKEHSLEKKLPDSLARQLKHNSILNYRFPVKTFFWAILPCFLSPIRPCDGSGRALERTFRGRRSQGSDSPIGSA